MLSAMIIDYILLCIALRKYYQRRPEPHTYQYVPILNLVKITKSLGVLYETLTLMGYAVVFYALRIIIKYLMPMQQIEQVNTDDLKIMFIALCTITAVLAIFDVWYTARIALRLHKLFNLKSKIWLFPLFVLPIPTALILLHVPFYHLEGENNDSTNSS